MSTYSCYNKEPFCADDQVAKQHSFEPLLVVTTFIKTEVSIRC